VGKITRGVRTKVKGRPVCKEIKEGGWGLELSFTPTVRKRKGQGGERNGNLKWSEGGEGRVVESGPSRKRRTAVGGRAESMVGQRVKRKFWDRAEEARPIKNLLCLRDCLIGPYREEERKGIKRGKTEVRPKGKEDTRKTRTGQGGRSQETILAQGLGEPGVVKNGKSQ